MSRLVALVVIALLLPAFAGCAEKAPSATGESIKPGSTGRAPTESKGTTPASTTPLPKGTSERWHFHDYWKGNPTITLFDDVMSLDFSLNDDGVPVYGHVLELPRGVIVPPETGFLTITINWTTPEPGPVNLTYRPADTTLFQPFANIEKGTPMQLVTTESMTDVPHRQESYWRFNFSAPAAVDPASGGVVAAPPKDLVVRIEATIGRPLFIDPPHLNWWAASQVLPLVSDATGEFASARLPTGHNATLVGTPPTPSPRAVKDNVTIAVDEGRIVPEGTLSIVVLLNWTSDVPASKLTLSYSEGNFPSQGPLELVQEGAGSRVFVMPVTNGMTDTTYSNRTTWQFHVLPEGDASAFRGTFTMYAWVTQHEPAEAVRYALGG